MACVRLTGALGVVATVLVLSMPATAQPVPPTPAREPGWPTLPVIGTIFEHREALGLSAAQVETLERLSLDLVRAAIRRRADLMITQLDLDVLLDQDPGTAVDVAAAEAKIREIEKIRSELQLALIRAVEAARAQLTAEQRSRLAALLAGTGAQRAADPAEPPRPALGAAAPPAGGEAPPRPPAGPRVEAQRDSHQGRAAIRIWPPFQWEPYWFYAPRPVVVQGPPVGQPSWYYCRSAQAYHPFVSSCPEPWLPLPAPPQ
jgi:hypothetical protein